MVHSGAVVTYCVLVTERRSRPDGDEVLVDSMQLVDAGSAAKAEMVARRVDRRMGVDVVGTETVRSAPGRRRLGRWAGWLGGGVGSGGRS